MKLQNYKKTWLFVCMLLVDVSAMAHPGHTDVSSVHGQGFGVWLMHQLYNVDYLLTIILICLVVALTGGGRLFRRRRSRRRLLPG